MDINDNFFDLCNLIGKTTVNNLLELFSNPIYKFILLTSHDNLLMPTVKYLIHSIIKGETKFDNLNYDKKYFNPNILHKINYLDFPDFNANLRFELWEDKLSNKKIRIYYSSLMLFEFS